MKRRDVPDEIGLKELEELLAEHGVPRSRSELNKRITDPKRRDRLRAHKSGNQWRVKGPDALALLESLLARKGVKES